MLPQGSTGQGRKKKKKERRRERPAAATFKIESKDGARLAYIDETAEGLWASRHESREKT